MKALLLFVIICYLQTIVLSEHDNFKKRDSILKSYPKKLSKQPIVIKNAQNYNLKFKLKRVGYHEKYTVFPSRPEITKSLKRFDSAFFLAEQPVKSKPSVKRVLPDYAKRIKRSATNNEKTIAPNKTKKDSKKAIKQTDSKKKTKSNAKAKPAESETKNLSKPKTENKVVLKKTPNSSKKLSRKSRKSARSSSSRKHLKHRRDFKTNEKNHNVAKRRSRHSNKRSGDGKQKLPVASRRLIGAKEAVIEDFPYVVSIQKDHEHWCSGALLNPRLVITTANCVWKSKNRSRLKVRAGSKYANHGGQVAKVQQVMKNPLWSIRADTPNNDLAVLLLDRRIRFSDRVHEVDLPNRAMMPSFEDAWVASWGTERRDGIYERPDMRLQVYHARLIDREKCRNATERFGVTVTQNFICLSQTGKRSPCTRDTGAPAVSDGILYGLASWSIRKFCGVERYPSMFSYVASNTNMDFIINATKILMSDERHYPFPDGLP